MTKANDKKKKRNSEKKEKKNQKKKNFRRWIGGDDDDTGWNDSHRITPTSGSQDGRWASKAGTHGNSLPSKKPHERLLPRV